MHNCDPLQGLKLSILEQPGWGTEKFHKSLFSKGKIGTGVSNSGPRVEFCKGNRYHEKIWITF